ncbi:unnamed protein product [Ixodes pacificus]
MPQWPPTFINKFEKKKYSHSDSRDKSRRSHWASASCSCRSEQNRHLTISFRTL